MNDWYDSPRKYESKDTLPPPTPGERALAELTKLPPADSLEEPWTKSCCRSADEHATHTGRQVYTDRIVEVINNRENGLEGVEGDIEPQPRDWDIARSALRRMSSAKRDRGIVERLADATLILGVLALIVAAVWGRL